MKKNLKKLGALVIAVAMIAALGTTAFAAETMTGEGGVIGEFETKDTPATKNTSVTIYKEITAYNPETSTVNAPTITYNYSISPATVTAGTTVEDNESRHKQVNGNDVTAKVAVKAGVGSPTITNVALTPTNTLKASVNGTANRFPITVDFSSITFTTAPATGAGVYRYVINEHVNSKTTHADDITQKNAAGIEEGTVADTLYIDVYVDGSGNIYGYVLFTNNTSIDGSGSGGEASAATAAGKVEGFVDDPDPTHEYSGSGTDVSTADKYYTFNLELKKVVSGDAYASSTHHEFPFNVSLTNSSVTAAVLPIMTVGTNATQTALTAAAIGGQTWTPKISDGATIKYVGIPCGTTVAVYETNDVDGVTYTASVENADGDVAAKAINKDETSNTATINCGATALKKATENHTASASKALTFTNSLTQISPTGVVMRVAPYVIILAAGIALFVISRRRRENLDA